MTRDPSLHRCEGDGYFAAYGAAIEYCDEDENGSGILWAGNGEYDSQVNYCPYCGYKARVQIVPGTSGRVHWGEKEPPAP